MVNRKFLKVAYINKESGVLDITTHPQKSDYWYKLENVTIEILDNNYCNVKYEDTGWRWNKIVLSGLDIEHKYSINETQNEFHETIEYEVDGKYLWSKPIMETKVDTKLGWVKLKDYKTISNTIETSFFRITYADKDIKLIR